MYTRETVLTMNLSHIWIFLNLQPVIDTKIELLGEKKIPNWKLSTNSTCLCISNTCSTKQGYNRRSHGYMLGQNLRKKNLAFQNILCTHLYKNMIEQKRDEKSLNFLCMSCKTNIWHYIYIIHDTIYHSHYLKPPRVFQEKSTSDWISLTLINFWMLSNWLYNQI